MRFLINASNLKAGGGIQVAQSICSELGRMTNHRFFVLLSTYINDIDIIYNDNTEVIKYDLNHTWNVVLFGRDKYLDDLIKEKNIDAVLTVFGPSIWSPRCPHLCGFARAQIILKNSPYYKNRSIKERLIYSIWKWYFRKSSKIFYTENIYISRLLEQFFRGIKVYTVTNYYNQIFDHVEKWKPSIRLPAFDGCTCLSVASPYPHKNFKIITGIVRYLRGVHPNFNVRFVLTFKKEEMLVPEDVRDSFVFIGKVDVSECPYLYEQADIMFMPTLLECFTATYPEAMRMGIPIVTTDLEFAKGLCGDAACYYSAVDETAAAEAIYKVANDKEYAKQLIDNGKKQLLTYDNYEQRAEKLIRILENIAKDYK